LFGILAAMQQTFSNYGFVNLKFIMSVVFVMAASVVWRSGFLAMDPEVRLQFPALPYFLRSTRSGKGFTQPRKKIWGATVDSRLSARGLTALRLNRGNVFLKKKF
jgi:hypothetical protein